METPETPTPRKSLMPYVIASALIVLLAAATFVAVRYYLGPKGTALGGPDRNVITLSGPGGEQTFSLNVKPAKELPTAQPEAVGLFVERKDNSIFVGTGDVKMVVQAKQGESPKADASFSGPKVEVVISADTIIYKDSTKFDQENPGTEVQQTVELSTIDEITEQSSITVWGRKAGDRVVADVIVFSTPFMIKAPGASRP